MAGALAVVGAAFAAFAPAASAEDAGRGGTFLRGRGVLDARGDGLVALKGRMETTLAGDGAILLVKDIAGDAEVDVEGDGGATRWHGFQVYFGTGTAEITGSHVAVILVGNDLTVHAMGKGWAYLKGDGSYMVNNHGPFPWSEEGAFAGIGEPPAAP
jgi:hypothetical protein